MIGPMPYPVVNTLLDAVLEHGSQLLGEALELLVVEVETGQPRHMGDVVSRDALGHTRS